MPSCVFLPITCFAAFDIVFGSIFFSSPGSCLLLLRWLFSVSFAADNSAEGLVLSATIFPCFSNLGFSVIFEANLFILLYFPVFMQPPPDNNRQQRQASPLPHQKSCVWPKGGGWRAVPKTYSKNPHEAESTNQVRERHAWSQLDQSSARLTCF